MIKNNNITIKALAPSDYAMFRDSMIEMYLESFTTGEYAQHIEPSDASSQVDSLVDGGYAMVALEGDKLIGFSIFTPLQYDKEFPKDSCNDIDYETSLYIAEVVVDINYRGRGVATMMINKILESGAQSYSGAVIRVWQNNKPALLLYQKLGFKSIASITQTKFASKNEAFEMHKVYLAKEI